MHDVVKTPGGIGSRTWNRQMLQETIETRLGHRKLIVVANREPYIHRYGEDGIECSRPASGMATALHPMMAAAGGTWIAHGSGNADRATVDAHDRVAVPPESPAYTLRRVWLTAEQEAGFYYGLANEGLWPLCHITFTRPTFRVQDWERYREVNALFAQAVLEESAGQPAVVFIQDYHFALLPRMLKELAGDRLTVVHFWHIPWPNPETFRAFPWHQELLEGMLGNDLLGFQIRHHGQNFLDTVDRGLEAKVGHDSFEIDRHGHTTRVRPFPISIDFEDHATHAESYEVGRAMDRWHDRLQLENRVLGIGMERLDYTKGLPERLRALDHLLTTRPEWRRKLVFVQVAVPTRSQIAHYREVEHEVDELVRSINARWQTADWRPLELCKEHFEPTEMMALHRLARFCVVNSLHDGMNLVAKEFVASRSDNSGALILSRFAGAQAELRDSLTVNPFAVHEVSEAMHQALIMPESEQNRRMSRMRGAVAYNNVFRWAGKILTTLLPQEADSLHHEAAA